MTPTDNPSFMDDSFVQAVLSNEIEKRYLNYALSVITSRAIPDIRDGLKPVQRRILYAMYHNLHLYPDSRFKKSASVVGDVLGKYHPHGDAAAYEALVRMAQDFSLRYPLIDGQGNFGSLDGDAAAAYRYTEAKLRPFAMELLSELTAQTVPMRDNFDGSLDEPVVLPAKVPHLLANGTTGIAVGMATNIPPHHLGEVIDAHLALIDNEELEVKDLLSYIKGPDFPTGGDVIAEKKQLREIYETGSGSIKIRAQYQVEEGKRGQKFVIIRAIPYGVSKSQLVERIGALVIAKKMPHILDVRDESTTLVRIVLELKKEAEPVMVMAYLFKHTPLQIHYTLNLTCLVPTESTLPTHGSDLSVPKRLNLKQMIQEFLKFRYALVQKRLEHDKALLDKKIHTLNGFEKIYSALDEVLKIIRGSEDKKDAKERLQQRFLLDDEQTEAILELKLYRLARLEIHIITQELQDKQRELKKIEAILGSTKALWDLIRQELITLKSQYHQKRLTKIIAQEEEIQVKEEDFIKHEEASVILTRDGWVKRIKELKDTQTTRLREGDNVAHVLVGRTDQLILFLSNQGGAYVCRIYDIPASSGYGEPIQKLFKFDDGEKIIAACSLDPQYARSSKLSLQLESLLKYAASLDKKTDQPADEQVLALGPHLLVITQQGFGFRAPLLPHCEPSLSRGRRLVKLQTGDEVVAVQLCLPSEFCVLVSQRAYVWHMLLSEIKLLSGAGRGSSLLTLKDKDQVLSVHVLESVKQEQLVLETESGQQETIILKNLPVHPISSKGKELLKKTILKSSQIAISKTE